MRQYTKLIFLLAAMITSLIACTAGPGTSGQAAQDKTGAATGLASIDLNNTGNGEYYGGKPQPGLYVRQVPDTKCPASPTVLGEVLVTNDGATEKVLNPKTCAVTTQSLNFEQLAYANYFTGRVGHAEGLYAKESSQNSGVVEEAWCRGISSTRATGFDVVIRADYKNRIYTAHVVSAKADKNGVIVRKEQAPIVIGRRFEAGERIRYRTEENFEIDIQTSVVNPWAGTMRGEFKYDMNGFDSEQWLECRLGGALDPALTAK